MQTPQWPWWVGVVAKLPGHRFCHIQIAPLAGGGSGSCGVSHSCNLPFLWEFCGKLQFLLPSKLSEQKCSEKPQANMGLSRSGMSNGAQRFPCLRADCSICFLQEEMEIEKCECLISNEGNVDYLPWSQERSLLKQLKNIDKVKEIVNHLPTYMYSMQT